MRLTERDTDTQPMLPAWADETPLADPYTTPTRRSILGAVARGLVPQLVEATIIPTAMFYLAYLTLGTVAAYSVALGWSYLAIGRRLVSSRPIPTLVLLTSIGITVRTVFALASGSTFVYFFQPILGKVVLSGVFLSSVAVGRPLIARFANDFCAMPADLATRPGVVRLYRRLTILWATVNLTAAAVTMVLLMTVPLGAYIAIKSVTGWVITSTGVVLTVSAAVRTAHAEDLLAAIAADGTLSARCGRLQRSLDGARA